MKQSLGCVAGALVLALWGLAARGAEPTPLKLWPDLPPGSPVVADAEQVRLTELGEHIYSSISRPSITPYFPDKATATGAAVIVIPGGGHSEIWIDHEGYRVAHWLSERGVAAFVLKYRLAKQAGSPYTVEKDELADAQRSIRYVRSHAAEWAIDPERVGIIGFSAGGELALLAGTRPGAADPRASDSSERQSAVPSFMALMYPAIPANLKVQAGLPPAFLLCGENDSPEIANGVPTLYNALRAAGVSAELHVLAHVGHGFGMRDTNPPAVANWTTLLYDWLDADGFLKQTGRSTGVSATSAGAFTAPTAATPSDTLRAGFPAARARAMYDSARIASIVTAQSGGSGPARLGRPVELTPNAPWSAGGAQLSVWKPSFVLGTAGGGEIGVNFWKIYEGGHVNVGFTTSPGTPTLLDCRVYGGAQLSYKIYVGDKGELGSQGDSRLADGHLLLLVPAKVPGPTSVELWPAPVNALFALTGCTLWPVLPGA